PGIARRIEIEAELGLGASAETVIQRIVIAGETAHFKTARMPAPAVVIVEIERLIGQPANIDAGIKPGEIGDRAAVKAGGGGRAVELENRAGGDAHRR